MKADDDNDLSKEATTLLRAPNTDDERNWNERKLNNDDANTVVCFRDDGNIGHWIGCCLRWSSAFNYREEMMMSI